GECAPRSYPGWCRGVVWSGRRGSRMERARWPGIHRRGAVARSAGMGGNRRGGASRGRRRRGRACERPDAVCAPCRGVGADRMILALVIVLGCIAVTALVLAGASVRVL